MLRVRNKEKSYYNGYLGYCSARSVYTEMSRFNHSDSSGDDDDFARQ